MCSKLLPMFYQSVVASSLFFAGESWGGKQTKKASEVGQFSCWIQTRQPRGSGGEENER